MTDRYTLYFITHIYSIPLYHTWFFTPSFWKNIGVVHNSTQARRKVKKIKGASRKKCGGHNLPPVGIGLTDLTKIGRGVPVEPLAYPVPPSLLTGQFMAETLWLKVTYFNQILKFFWYNIYPIDMQEMSCHALFEHSLPQFDQSYFRRFIDY